MTRDVLHATVQLARRRRAIPVVVIPRFGVEDPVQEALRLRILTEDISAIVVPLEPDWRLRWDRHPNARAAHVIAEAIVARLDR